MGYRYDGEPPKPEDHLRKFAVRNGAIMRIAFGCYYLYGHDSKYHDHIGWPNPDNPDDICQLESNFRLYPFKDKTQILNPIHLLEEGYDEIYVTYEDQEKASYLTTTAWIDEQDDSIIRIKVKTNFPTFSDKPVEIRFTVFAKNTEEDLIDSVCHGVIAILPGSPQPD